MATFLIIFGLVCWLLGKLLEWAGSDKNQQSLWKKLTRVEKNRLSFAPHNKVAKVWPDDYRE